jgi:hypothetical protein
MNPLLEILPPWETLDEFFTKAWEDDYAVEIAKGHPLYGVPAKALAYDRLDVLFRLFRHPCQYAVVELTHSGREEPPPARPAFALFRDVDRLMHECVQPRHEVWRNEIRGLVQASGHFCVFLTPKNIRHHYDVFARLPIHETVLRPLLRIAEACWVYGISPGSRIWTASSSILKPYRGKHGLLLGGELLIGHELLWNAHGGERGTIVIQCSAESLRTIGVFQHCYRPNTWGNVGAGHTSSAIRLAKEKVQDGSTVALCLSRNNGIEWMDIFALPDLALSLFDLAFELHSRE